NKPLASLPQPRVVAVQAAVALHPEERRYEIHGTYVLANETDRPIDRVVVTARRDVRSARLSIANARETHDARFGQSVFTLAHPLAPRDRIELRFDLAYANPGFDAENGEIAIVGN